jgi:tetratricopeptide (TPR) repeat protein
MEGLRRSALCFEQAIKVDPACVSAYAGLADTLTLQAEYGFADGPTCMHGAKAAVEQALALNSESAEAQASRGLILVLYDRSWEAAGTAFRRSLSLNVSYAPAHHWYSVNYLAMLSRFTEAENELEAAITLDPLSPVVLEGRGLLRLLRRDYSDAISQYATLTMTDPSFYKGYAAMGRAYLHAGENELAVQLLEKGLSLAGDVPSVLAALGQAYGVAGNRAAARQVVEKLRQIAGFRPVPSTCFALVHLGLNEKDEALKWLELAVERRESSVVAYAVHPAYDLLRGDARFEALVHTIMPSSVLP